VFPENRNKFQITLVTVPKPLLHFTGKSSPNALLISDTRPTE